VSRAQRWASTMAGRPEGATVLAHADDPGVRVGPVAGAVVGREAREEREEAALTPGATRSRGAGRRRREETADPWRTCFERDRDRILHSAPFRRLAGKTQVFVYPRDHQRTRLTHALEVAQVATAASRALGLNVALTEAIALGHDCGHGPGGHASEDAFSPYLPGGYDHAIWGADVVLAPLNLCEETLDGIRHHSWSLPSPLTPEGQVVSWADRCAYSAHDFEDAVSAGLVEESDLPAAVSQVAGTTRSAQLNAFVTSLVQTTATTGLVSMATDVAGALAELRRFNYERVYTQPRSLAQGQAVVSVLRALVEFYAEDPARLDPVPPGRCGPGVGGRRLPPGEPPAPEVTGDEGGEALRRAVAYVAGMTDRFAFETAVERLGWDPRRLPRGVDVAGGAGGEPAGTEPGRIAGGPGR